MQQITVENGFQLILIEDQKSAALSSTHLALSKGGFNFGEVALYLPNAEFNKLDDKDEPTGETYTAALLSLKNGREIELNEAEHAFFKQLWEKKIKIDRQKINLVLQLDNLQFPAKPATT